MASGTMIFRRATPDLGRLFEADAGSVAGLDDAALWERFALGRDEAAFEALVVRHGPMVLATARGIVGDHHAAEDVAQATFVALARRGGAIRRSETLGPWLHRVAARAALRQRAATRRRLDRERAAGARGVEPAPAVHAELDRLPAAYRLPIVLCDLEGWTRASAAAHLGWTEGAVRGRLDRGRARLRARLARRGLAPAISATVPVLLWGGEASAAALAALAPAGLAPRLIAAVVRAAVVAAADPSSWARRLAAGVAVLATDLGSIRSGLIALGCAGSIGLIAAGGWAWWGGPSGGDPGAASEPMPPIGRPLAAPGRATPPPDQAPAEVPTVALAGPERPEDLVDVRGQVVDPLGAPVPGATVRVAPYVEMLPRPAATTVAADAAGRFALRVPRRLLVAHPYASGVLVASSPRFGLAWLALGQQAIPDPAQVRLALVPDPAPIEGRIVGPDGRPVAGATVAVDQLYAPRTPDLTAWADRVRRSGTRGAWEGAKWGQLVGLGPIPEATAQTDADGRFRLTGLGAERVADLIVAAPGCATVAVAATTQDRGAIVSADRGEGFPALTFHPAHCDLTLAAGRVVEGIVRDADTGAPIADLPLEGQFPEAGANNVPIPGIAATTDAAGHYRLAGFPIRDYYRIYIRPGRGQPYLRGNYSTRIVADPRPDLPVVADLSLRRGVLIRGRVVDASTGEPLVNASVTTYALKGNDQLDRYPGVTTDALAYARTDTAGRYEIAALPGRGLLTVLGLYGIGVPKDYAGVDGFNPRTRNFETTGGRISNLDFADAVATLRPEPGSSPTVDLTVDRGRTVAGTLVDPEGQPLVGTTSFGVGDTFRRSAPNPTDRFEARQVDPKHPRRAFFYHEGRQFVGSVVLRGDEAGPVVVRLEPWGSVAGRLVGKDGKPLTNCAVMSGFGADRVDLSRGRCLNEHVEVDADGRFRLEGLVPSLSHNAAWAWGIAGGGLFLQDLRVGPGEARDLGDVLADLTDGK